jgi:hypothetical protein
MLNFNLSRSKFKFRDLIIYNVTNLPYQLKILNNIILYTPLNRTK